MYLCRCYTKIFPQNLLYLFCITWLNNMTPHILNNRVIHKFYIEFLILKNIQNFHDHLNKNHSLCFGSPNVIPMQLTPAQYVHLEFLGRNEPNVFSNHLRISAGSQLYTTSSFRRSPFCIFTLSIS
jgi:hypothetical protein